MEKFITVVMNIASYDVLSRDLERGHIQNCCWPVGRAGNFTKMSDAFLGTSMGLC